MTCIIALKHNDIICMGADAAASTQTDVATIKSSKIFLNGEFLIGSAGSNRVAQILEHGISFPGQSGNQTDAAYVSDMFGEHARQVILQRGAARKESEEECHNGQHLVVYRGSIYTVLQDWSVVEFAYPYSGVGSGEVVAKGALYALVSTLSQDSGKEHIKSIVKTSLEASQEFTVGVRGPFDFCFYDECFGET